MRNKPIFGLGSQLQICRNEIVFARSHFFERYDFNPFPNLAILNILSIFKRFKNLATGWIRAQSEQTKEFERKEGDAKTSLASDTNKTLAWLILSSLLNNLRQPFSFFCVVSSHFVQKSIRPISEILTTELFKSLHF